MSMQLLSNSDISSIALFGHMTKVDNSKRLAETLHALNMGACNRRYSEDNSPREGVLQSNADITPEKVYSNLGYWENNSIDSSYWYQTHPFRSELNDLRGNCFSQVEGLLTSNYHFK
jgi:hypothetical protein